MTAPQLNFHVKGSAAEPYRVVFRIDAAEAAVDAAKTALTAARKALARAMRD